MADLETTTMAVGEPADLAALRQADQARYRAMLSGDLAALDALLADELSYTHSSALRESKAEYLGSIRSGRVRYLHASLAEVGQAVYGDMAVMQGKALLRAVVDGAERTLDNRFLSVWRRHRGAWQMLAWASTPMPAASAPPVPGAS
ncbi:nuclear transport factor 2 family protein [Cupriavidus necator]|uniref:nuclear transport factor 2 family protein n=1 Tax=Cupriavidus necator TaxID=106590 RepID=UPI003ECC9C2E